MSFQLRVYANLHIVIGWLDFLLTNLSYDTLPIFIKTTIYLSESALVETSHL